MEKKEFDLSVIRAYVGLAYAIIGQAERDERKYEHSKKNKKYYISEKDYSFAKEFEKTELYDVCITLIDEYARVTEEPGHKISNLARSGW